MTKARYHADVVGSLLRPQKLIEARQAMRAGELPYPEYRAIEDAPSTTRSSSRRIAGLEVVTDGELRRDIYLRLVGLRDGRLEH